MATTFYETEDNFQHIDVWEQYTGSRTSFATVMRFRTTSPGYEVRAPVVQVISSTQGDITSTVYDSTVDDDITTDAQGITTANLWIYLRRPALYAALAAGSVTVIWRARVGLVGGPYDISSTEHRVSIGYIPASDPEPHIRGTPHVTNYQMTASAPNTMTFYFDISTGLGFSADTWTGAAYVQLWAAFDDNRPFPSGLFPVTWNAVDTAFNNSSAAQLGFNCQYRCSVTITDMSVYNNIIDTWGNLYLRLAVWADHYNDGRSEYDDPQVYTWKQTQGGLTPPYISIVPRIYNYTFNGTETGRFQFWFDVQTDPTSINITDTQLTYFAQNTGYYVVNPDNITIDQTQTLGGGRYAYQVGMEFSDLLTILNNIDSQGIIELALTGLSGTSSVTGTGAITVEKGTVVPPPGNLTPEEQERLVQIDVDPTDFVFTKNSTGNSSFLLQIHVSDSDVIIYQNPYTITYRVYSIPNLTDITSSASLLAVPATYDPLWGRDSAAHVYRVQWSIDNIRALNILSARKLVLLTVVVPWEYGGETYYSRKSIMLRLRTADGAIPPVFGSGDEDEPYFGSDGNGEPPITRIGATNMVNNHIINHINYRRIYYKAALDPQDSYLAINYVISLDSWYRKMRYPERWQRIHSPDFPNTWISDDGDTPAFTGGMQNDWYNGAEGVFVEQPITKLFLQDGYGNVSGTYLIYYNIPYGVTHSTSPADYGSTAYLSSGLVYYQNKSYIYSQKQDSAIRLTVEKDATPPAETSAARPYVTQHRGVVTPPDKYAPPDVTVIRRNSLAYLTDLPSRALQTDMTKWYVSELNSQRTDGENDNTWYHKWVPILKYPTSGGNYILVVDSNGNVSYQDIGDINNTAYNFYFLWGNNNNASTTYANYTAMNLVLPNSTAIPLGVGAGTGEAWFAQQLYNNGARTNATALYYAAAQSTSDPRSGTTLANVIGYPWRCMSTDGVTFQSVNEGSVNYSRHTLLDCRIVTYSN